MSASPEEGQGPGGRSELGIAIGLGLLLLLASRLPFLLSNSEWGVFFPEHLWMITDPLVMERWARVGATGGGQLAQLDPAMYAEHYHAGAFWVTRAIGWMHRLTGATGLLPMKLVALLASMLGVVAWLIALARVWPRERLRWGAAIFVVWLAPPSLLLWATLMPMGHYLETWFFHAVFLPPLVLVLADRDGPLSLAASGVLAGLCTAYVFSNLVFPALLAGLLLVLPRRRRLDLGLPERLLGAQGILVAAQLGAYTLFLPGEPGGLIVSYLAITYPAVLFGLSQGAITLAIRSSRRNPLPAVPALGLFALLAVGWAQSCLALNVGAHGPGIQPAEYRTVPTIASLETEGLLVRPADDNRKPKPDVEALREYCLRAYPGDEAFCRVIAWQPVMGWAEIDAGPEVFEAEDHFTRYEGMARVAAAVCTDVPPDHRSACAMADASRFSEELPARNSLVYQQCLHLDLLVPDRGLYPPCAIGVAKLLEGLTCSWSGAELRL